MEPASILSAVRATRERPERNECNGTNRGKEPLRKSERKEIEMSGCGGVEKAASLAGRYYYTTEYYNSDCGGTPRTVGTGLPHSHINNIRLVGGPAAHPLPRPPAGVDGEIGGGGRT